MVAARPVATPSAGWNLEIDIGGERVQMSSATLLAAGTRLLLRALSPERVRVEQVLGEPAQLQLLRNALRSDLPIQVPLREAIGGLATLAADPALPAPLRERIGELLAQLAHPRTAAAGRGPARGGAEQRQFSGTAPARVADGGQRHGSACGGRAASTRSARGPGRTAAPAATGSPGPVTANAPVTAGPAVAAAASAAAAATQPAPPGSSPGSAATSAAVSTGIAADLKGQLFVLLDATSGWLRARPDASRGPPGGGNPAAPGLPLYTARGLVSGDPAPAQADAESLPAADPMVARLAQQLAATEPARPRDPADLVETLLRYVVGALARTRVHQLGVHPEIRRQGDSSPLQAWSVEIPIAHGGRMDALELRVEDHGRREESARRRPTRVAGADEPGARTDRSAARAAAAERHTAGHHAVGREPRPRWRRRATRSPSSATACAPRVWTSPASSACPARRRRARAATTTCWT